MGLDELLACCRDLVEDPDFPTVRRWRQAGGKVLGHFQVYFPEEIAHAAGMLAVKVRGAPLEPRRSDSLFGSYLCSILRTSLEAALSQRLELDLFVTHPICDAARSLAGIWGRNLACPATILYLPQNANSGAARAYLRGEYDRLRRQIEQVAGRPVGEDDLRASIRLYNESRRLLAELYRLRRQEPWKVTLEESYVLVALAGLVPRHEHNQLMQHVLPLLRQRPGKPQDRVRVVLEGGFCEQPPLDLLRAVGRSCYVVDDDLLIGLRWIQEPVAEEGDPLENLAEAYLDRSSYSPVQHDARKPKEQMLLGKVRDSGAEAAVLLAAKMCEPGLDEQVAYARALDQAGIPYFVSEFEERQSSFDDLQIQLETFVENLLFD
jgi:benzoyl-CoA reductase subunit C